MSAAPISVYGLKNCDSCKKARKWAEANKVAIQFIDLRDQPPSKAQLQRWLKIAGGETLINRRGTTYRALTDAEKAALDTADTALPILSEKSALMKRPIFEIDQALFVGFTAEAQAALIGAGS